MRSKTHAPVLLLVGLLVACANPYAELISRIPPDALFAVPLNEFAPRVPDYRRTKREDIFTERMGFAPKRGFGFAQFTYVLGPPGSFTPSDSDEAGAPAALALAVRGDPLFAKRSLTFGSSGIAENRYGDVHWHQFFLPGYQCAALGQAFDEQSGLHGYYCLVRSEPIDEERIQEAALRIIRRPLDTVGPILR